MRFVRGLLHLSLFIIPILSLPGLGRIWLLAPASPAEKSDICLFGQKYCFLVLLDSINTGKEKNVDQYQDLSAPGCTLNWLVKNPGNEPEFSKNSNYLTRFTILLGVAKSTSKGNQSFHLLHCKYASPYVCLFFKICFFYFLSWLFHVRV